MTGKHILCIEDQTELREDLVHELGEAGYRVSEASDGAAGLRTILGGGIDLVLCDIQMPRLNGLDLIAETRRQVLEPIPSFVLLTAYSDQSMRARAGDLGVDSFLVKPIDYTELLELCADLLGSDA